MSWGAKLWSWLSGDAVPNPSARSAAQAPAPTPVFPSSPPPVQQAFNEASDRDYILGALSAALDQRDGAAVCEEVGNLIDVADTLAECLDFLQATLSTVATWDDHQVLLNLVTLINGFEDDGNNVEAMANEVLFARLQAIELKDPALAMSLYVSFLSSDNITDRQIDAIADRIECMAKAADPVHIPGYLEHLYEAQDTLDEGLTARTLVQDQILHLGRVIEAHDPFHTLMAYKAVYEEADKSDPRNDDMCRKILDVSKALMFAYPEQVEQALQLVSEHAEFPLDEQADGMLEILSQREGGNAYDDVEPMAPANFLLKHAATTRAP